MAADFTDGESFDGNITAGKKIYEKETHKSKLLGTTKKGVPTKVLGRKGNYYKVSHGQHIGYIYRKNLIIVAESRRIDQPDAFDTMFDTASETFTSYAEKNHDLKEDLACGHYTELEAKLDKRYGKVKELDEIKEHAEDINLLPAIERGCYEFEAGRYAESVEYFAGAEQTLKHREDSSHTEGIVSSFLNLSAKAVSMDEFAAYEGPGFENVLLLNYKALGHLMMANAKPTT